MPRSTALATCCATLSTNLRMMSQCLSRALHASTVLCVDTCALLLELDLWTNRCKVPMTFTVRDGIQQRSKVICYHSCKSFSCACAHFQILHQTLVIQPQQSFQFGDPADLLACWWLSVGILQLSGGVDVAGTRNPPSRACKPLGSFRSQQNGDHQLRQVTFIGAIESLMQLVLGQLLTPHSRHCRCPIRTLALPSDPNSLRLEQAQHALRVFRHRLRTSIECFLHCPRKRWDRCWKGGKVVSPNSPTVPRIESAKFDTSSSLPAF